MDWNPLRINNTDDIIDPIGYVEELMRDYAHLIVKNIFNVDAEHVEGAHSSSLPLPF